MEKLIKNKQKISEILAIMIIVIIIRKAYNIK